MKYKTIYADPPWNESGGGKIKRGADKHYPLMKTKEILEMSKWIDDISDENCHLYMWTTNNHLPDALKVVDGWGFRYITMITWTKDRFGLGQYFRGQTEHCIFAVKGKLPYKTIEGKRQQGTTSIISPRLEHSRKPDEMYEYIEKVSYPPYIELFARRRRDNWDSWGNQV